MKEQLIRDHELLASFVKGNWRKSLNEPSGILKHKFIDPAANYRAQLWDWDSYFCGVSLIDVYEDTAEYVKGCVDNFLEYQAQDGSVPYMINVGKPNAALPVVSKAPRSDDSDLNSIKPLLCRMAMLAYGKLSDKSWLVGIYPSLKLHIAHWESTQRMKNGLFVWRSYRGSGTDNHPAVYGRPLNSSAAVELNCLMYAEYKAVAEIASICGDTDGEKAYTNSAAQLAADINTHMWDPIDGLYYNLDMLSSKPPLARQEVTWNVPLKFRAWTCFMPMWAGIAPKEYADRMVREHLMNSSEFLSDYGVRTLAKCEPLYSTTEMGNPSNWQGPVWIVSTYLIFKGVLDCGYYTEALQIAENLVTNLARDIRENGLLHEYYNPETGNSTINPGFMNWNGLAALMVPELIKYREAHDET